MPPMRADDSVVNRMIGQGPYGLQAKCVLIDGVQTVSAGGRTLTLSGLPLAIFVDAFTRFDGGRIDSLNDLQAGFEIEVTGFTRTDGAIYATRVHLVSKGKH